MTVPLLLSSQGIVGVDAGNTGKSAEEKPWAGAERSLTAHSILWHLRVGLI